jgi:DNA polymerase III delta prime subunit
MSNLVSPVTLFESRKAIDRLRTAMQRTIKGKDEIVEQVIECLAAGGHVLIEDLPGLGKTTLAWALARSTDCAFSRVQFTSDLWPSDVTGVAIYNDRERSFVFKPGPVFASVVLADETNRATPKTQSGAARKRWTAGDTGARGRGAQGMARGTVGFSTVGDGIDADGRRRGGGLGGAVSSRVAERRELGERGTCVDPVRREAGWLLG